MNVTLSSGKKFSEIALKNSEGEFIEVGQKVSVESLVKGCPRLKGVVIKIGEPKQYSVEPGKRGVKLSIPVTVHLENGNKIETAINVLTPASQS